MVNRLSIEARAVGEKCDPTSNAERPTSDEGVQRSSAAFDVERWTSNVGRSCSFLLIVAIALFTHTALAQPKTPPKKERAQSRQPADEAEYYKILTFEPPDEVMLEAGAMAVLPDGKTVACSTRRGDVYFIENAFAEDPAQAKFKKWATGMHEVLGLAYNPKDQFLYAVQRGEVTRLKDTDGDGVCDVYETFCDDWGISGDYHEYA